MWLRAGYNRPSATSITCADRKEIRNLLVCPVARPPPNVNMDAAET